MGLQRRRAPSSSAHLSEAGQRMPPVISAHRRLAPTWCCEAQRHFPQLRNLTLSATLRAEERRRHRPFSAGCQQLRPALLERQRNYHHRSQGRWYVRGPPTPALDTTKSFLTNTLFGLVARCVRHRSSSMARDPDRLHTALPNPGRVGFMAWNNNEPISRMWNCHELRHAEQEVFRAGGFTTAEMTSPG